MDIVIMLGFRSARPRWGSARAALPTNETRRTRDRPALVYCRLALGNKSSGSCGRADGHGCRRDVAGRAVAVRPGPGKQSQAC